MRLVTIGEVCTVINGGTPDTKVSEYWDGEHAWITPAEMGNLKSPFLTSSRRTLTDAGISNSSAHLVPKHSVIMSSRAPIGHLVINEVPMASNQGCKSLIPNDELNYKYLYYFLFANRDFLNSLGSGTTFAEISGTKLKSVLIPLPPLVRQSEIVEKLDKAFAEIDLLETNLGQSEENANQLAQSLVSLAFKSGGVADDESESSRIPPVREVKLSEICTFSRGLTYSKADEVEFSNNIVLRANNIDLETNSLNLHDLRYIKDSVNIKLDKKVQKNSLLICTASGSKSHVGKVALIDQDYDFAFGGFMGMLTPSDLCHPKFLFYLLTSATFKKFLMSLNDGTNINNLKFSDIEDYKVILPTIERQIAIVEILDRSFADINAIRLQLGIQRELSLALRQSILHREFLPRNGVA